MLKTLLLLSVFMASPIFSMQQKSKVTTAEKMIPLKTLKDIEAFENKVVAYAATTYYFNSNSADHPYKGKQFALIDHIHVNTKAFSPEKSPEGESCDRYLFKKLVIPNVSRHSVQLVYDDKRINPEIEEGSLQVRLATAAELAQILADAQVNKVEFEYAFDFAKNVKPLLEAQMKSQQTQKKDSSEQKK